MRLVRHTALAAVTLAGVVSLAGCSLLPSDSDPTPASSAATQSTQPVTSAAPVATATPTPQASPGDGLSQSPSASTSTSPGAVASTPAAAPVPATRYNDKTSLLQLPVSPEALPGAPDGLVTFAEQQLTQMWHEQFHDELGCQGIAQVRIKRTTPTQAYVDVSWGDMTPTCPQYAGNPGWWEVWGSDGDATWSLVLRGQGTAACADLVSADIPRSIYPSCSDGTRKVPNPVA